MKEIPQACLQYYVRHFPIKKGKNRLLHLLWEPLSFNRYKRRTTLRHANVKMDCDLTKFLQRQIYFWGAYEEEQTVSWMQYARDAKVIFDIGANAGIYSLLAASVNPQAEIHAFEPTPELFADFLNNIRLNDIQNIIANEVAIGKTDETGFVHVCKGSDGSNEAMNYVTSENLRQSDLPTEIRSIDSYCRQNRIDRIDLMKIDIEGGEYNALLGAKGLLESRSIGCIFIELLDWAADRYGHSTSEIEQLLRDAGYHLYEYTSRKLIPVKAGATQSGDANVIALAREPAFS